MKRIVSAFLLLTVLLPFVASCGKESKKTTVPTTTKPDVVTTIPSVPPLTTAPTTSEPPATTTAPTTSEPPATTTAPSLPTPETYTITFVSRGGSAVAPITVNAGAVANAPTAPEYEEYHFVGWFTDSSLTEAVDWSKPITKNCTYYAGWNEKVKIVELLKTLLASYEVTPYSYIPETMLPSYATHLLSSTTVPSYSYSVSVSNIPTGGFGEQWAMVLDNLDQSQLFFEILGVVEGVSATSVAAFNDYMDKNPSSVAQHTFKSGVYSVAIRYDGEVLLYVLEYETTLPVIGTVTVQIAMALDVASGAKTVRVQLNEANALAYTFTEDSYEFAIRYLGVRRAYFSIERNADDTVEGHIYEYLTVSAVELASAADFYIDDSYVSVVGNKADGLLGFTGYINELYDVANGKLLGYEVREVFDKIVTIEYNTYWFDLSDFGGINSVRCIEGDDGFTTYVNGATTAWVATKFGGISTKRESRRYDIELRTRYSYVYDADSETYVRVEYQVPMLFIQEEKYDDLIDDVKDDNDIALTVKTDQAAFRRLSDDYDVNVDIFIENKDAYTVDMILGFISDSISFD